MLPGNAVGKNVVVIGGGLAGLAASIYLARAGRSVTLFEKRRSLGGRAITQIRQGFRFNLGPHAVYRRGAAAGVYRELGVPVRGKVVPSRGIALYGGKEYRLPASFTSLLTSSLLSPSARIEAAKLLLRVRFGDPAEFGEMTVREFLDRRVQDPVLRHVMSAFIRLATYSDQDEEQSASAALEQLRIATGGVIYVDEGWQKLVDTLHSHAVAAGVNFVTSCRVVGVEHSGAVRAIELGDLELDQRMDTLSLSLEEITRRSRGTRIPAETVLMAIDPASVRELVGESLGPKAFVPVTATCLDLALSRLPDPKRTFALGVDEPFYVSVHSAHAQLTPRGGALIHVMRYRKKTAPIVDVEVDEVVPHTREVAAEERELESVLDRIQPGWRNHLVHRRFLPAMTVSHSLRLPQAARPLPRSPIRGLYLAGDWVGEQGMLSDASLASARTAARAILSDTEVE